MQTVFENVRLYKCESLVSNVQSLSLVPLFSTHGLLHTTFLCPLVSPGVCSNSQLPRWLRCKESACSVGDLGSIPGSGITPAEGNGNPLQYSCPENSMNKGAWRATVHGVVNNQTWLSHSHFHFHVHQVSDAIQPAHPPLPLLSCPQFFPTSGSFQMSWLFTSSGPSIGASASASVLTKNI